ncbi:subclass B1 metallo-beta-lactamase [Flammeovirga sp. SubArs3]|uniref:subclass B1 metallo-beta-lactamase n=1 Tax=Flammeovirga sp. SubArs3 TaxID=2995316 RepID=UPI00248B72E2|nr:subclass B1 metallo-beta-lactamase [Flammeovirga sp. SubArs3]
MKNIIRLVYISLLISSCQQEKELPKEYINEDLELHQLSEHVWQHISFLNTEEWGKVPCNGMVVIDDGEAIIIDTPTDVKSTQLLYNWLTENDITIKGAVPTHFHIDCLGGLSYLHSKNVASYASNSTIQLAKENGFEAPQNGFTDTLTLQVDDHPVILKFKGSGHTKDNIVAYVPNDKVLFGGCIVKGKGWSKGNLADADTLSWANSIQNIKSDFNAIEVVIPGHGKVGNTELLDYTFELFK